MEHLSELQKYIFFLIHDFLFLRSRSTPPKPGSLSCFCWLFVVCWWVFVVTCLSFAGCWLFFFGIAKSLSKLVILTCFFVSNLFESLVFLPLTCLGLKFSVVRRNSGPASRP